MERTKEQQRAIETGARRVCVDAGAGSGKTRVLIERIVWLLETRRARLDEVVAITFTENAASEMKNRLRAAFRERAPQRDPEKMSFWRNLERNVDSSRIATIHGFCSSILRENALAIGIDPEFTVLADADATLLLTQSVTDALRNLAAQAYAPLLQITHDLGLAELRELLRSFLRNRAAIARISARGPLCDTDALRSEWNRVLRAERERRLLALRLHPDVHGAIRRLKRFEGQCENPEDGRELRRIEYLAALTAIASAKSSKTVAEAIAAITNYKGKNGARKNWPAETIYEQLSNCQDAVRKLLQDYRPVVPNEAIERRAEEQTAALYAVYERVADTYARAKAARNGLDFEDLILRALETLRADNGVRARIARGIRYLFIDEFQDTDHLQLDIARLLNDEKGGPDLFIVGDAKQSIYLFRGAEVGVFAEQRGVSDETIPLDRNFRAIPEIIGPINAFFARSRALAAVQEHYAPMLAHRSASGETRVEFLIPHETEGWLTDDYRRAEANGIAARIIGMCNAATGVMLHRDTAPEHARFRDVAILLREMNHAYIYEDALSRAGIPYMVVSGKGFYEQQEVIDLLNLLEVLIDPWNERALFAFLRSPIAGLSDDELLCCRGTRGLAASFNGYDERETGRPIGPWNRARALISRLREQLLCPLPELLRRILDETGFEAILLSQHLGLQRAANVRKLIDLAGVFTGVQPPTLRAFVDYVNTVRDEAVREGQAIMQPEGDGAVTIMTVHKSKGLEFPVVFLPDTSQGRNTGASRSPAVLHGDLGLALKPIGADGERTLSQMAAAIVARHEEEQIAEHARLLYVAMTRARDALVISGSPKATPGSWLAWLDAEFDILRAADGHEIPGDGWAAIIRRDLAAPENAEHVRVRPEPVSMERIDRMVAKVEPVTPVQQTVSISRLLDTLCGKYGGGTAIDTSRATGDGLDPLTFGTLVHRMFEQWDFVSGSEPDYERLLGSAGIPLVKRAAARERLMRIADRFRDSALAAKMGRDPGLRREIPFSLRIGSTLVAGKIDALLGDGAIIDYKTGAIHEHSAARYEVQIQLYAAAVQALSGKTPRHGLLWYAETGELKEVDVSTERIGEVLARAENPALSLPPADIDEVTPADL